MDLNEVATDLNHGQMTVVVRYNTQYTLADKGTFPSILHCVMMSACVVFSVYWTFWRWVLQLI